MQAEKIVHHQVASLEYYEFIGVGTSETMCKSSNMILQTMLKYNSSNLQTYILSRKKGMPPEQTSPPDLRLIAVNGLTLLTRFHTMSGSGNDAL